MSHITTAAKPNISFVIQGGATCPGYYSHQNTSSHFGIVVLQEWGLNLNMVSVADYISRYGFQTIVPDLYRGEVAQNDKEAHHKINDLKWEKALVDVHGAVDFLKKEKQCRKVCVLGFCAGGSLSIAAATSLNHVDAAVAFYGTPDTKKWNLSHVHIPVLMHFGDKDAHTGFSDPATALSVFKSLQSNHIDVQLFMYPDAGHAFANADEPKNYNAAAAELAWKRTFDWLGSRLGMYSAIQEPPKKRAKFDHELAPSTNENPKTWHEVLESQKCGQIDIKGKKRHHFHQVVVAYAEETTEHALKRMAMENILSLPIIRKVDNTTEFLGFVDVLDICGYVSMLRRRNAARIPFKDPDPREFLDTPVSKLVNFSGADTALSVSENANFKQAINILKSHDRFQLPHRVALIHPNNMIAGIITQSDIVSIAFKFKETSIPAGFLNKTVSELGYVKSVVSVRVDETMAEALRLLYVNKIGGLALVDESDKLIGTFSASDLRGINVDAFHMFTGSILQFMAKGTSTTPKAALFVSSKATLLQAITTLTENRLHRVWVVDDNDHPIGVVTLSDIVELLLQQ